MRRAASALCLAAVAAGLAACARLPPPAVAAGGAAPPAGRQSLYRVQYEGPAGRGSLRLVLRRLAEARFQIQTSDALGRAVWSLDLDAGGSLLVDHRQRAVCRAGAELRVPEVALAPLPLAALPRVLAGLAPLEPPPAAADPLDWIDGGGRRWALRQEGGVLEAWTMWQRGEPRLWWQRQPRGGILSHRDGSQFRWRLVVEEPFGAASYRPLTAPPEYRQGACEGLAGGGLGATDAAEAV